MNISKKYLSTGEVAEMFSVCPDTVLRWARNGKIPAIRTPGGHFRIYHDQIIAFVTEKISQDEDKSSTLQYCWEFHSKSGNYQRGCTNCAVYRVKAIRCYEMMKLSDDIGHEKIFCKTCCHECDYYKSIVSN